MRHKELQLIAFVCLLVLPWSAWAAAYNYEEWLYNLASHMPQMIRLVVAVSYLSGVLFIAMGVLKLRAYGQQTVMMSTHADARGPLIYIIVGTILVWFPHMVETGIYTLWGYGLDEANSLHYVETIGNAEFQRVIEPVIAIVRVVGYIAFLRGWFMIAKMGQQGGSQPGTMSKAILHIIGGILAIHIQGTWQVLDNTVKFVFIPSR